MIISSQRWEPLATALPALLCLVIAIQPTAAAGSNWRAFRACLQIPQLAGYTVLHTLEVSYNSISSLQPLTSLQSTNLRELYVANNAVQQIEVE